MSKKKTSLKCFEILVPTTIHTVFHVEAENEEAAIKMVLSDEVCLYDVVEETPESDSNNYIVTEIDND